mgnify:CR=1 FL=1
MRSPLTLGIASGALDIDVVDGPVDVTRDREYGYAVHPRVGLSATIEAVGSRPDPLRFALRFVATPVLGLPARSSGQSTPAERFGAVVAAAFLLGLIDYLIRLQDHGVRFIFSLAVLGVLTWATYRFLYPVLRRTPGDLAAAQRIESHYPQLGDELSSTVAFLAQPEDDVTAGSAALRRAVIAQTVDDVNQLNLSDVIDHLRWSPKPSSWVALTDAGCTDLWMLSGVSFG